MTRFKTTQKASKPANVTPNIQSSSSQSLYLTPSVDELADNQQQTPTTTENMQANEYANATPNIQVHSTQSLYLTPSLDELSDNQQQQQTTTNENMQANEDANATPNIQVRSTQSLYLTPHVDDLPDDDYPFYIFDSLCCTYISSGDKYESLRTVRIDKILKVHVAKPWHKMIFPIVAGEHWTLLVLDNLLLEWFFYNSLKPRTNNRNDPYEADARVVKAYVEEKLKHFMTESVKNGDPYKYGYMHTDETYHTGLTQDDCDWE